MNMYIYIIYIYTHIGNIYTLFNQHIKLAYKKYKYIHTYILIYVYGHMYILYVHTYIYVYDDMQIKFITFVRNIARSVLDLVFVLIFY